MRNMNDEQRRHTFREWLKAELRRLDFWQRRGNRFFISEFVRYAHDKGAHVEEVPLGRWLRDENPTLPSVESCRELARVLDMHGVEVMLAAGYLVWEDVAFIVDQFERGENGVPNYRGRSMGAGAELPPARPGMATGTPTR